MMRDSVSNLAGAYLIAARLAGCGGNSLSSPGSAAPQVVAPHSAASGAGYKSIYSFKGGADGATPVGDALLPVNGDLYGMTSGGGTSGNGTVFKVSASGKHQVIYNFSGGTDGASPRGGLIDVAGTLYGTTRSGGGTSGYGTVFKVSTSGTEHVIYKFNGTDGANPYVGLTNVGGKLYGTTPKGGESNAGTVFAVNTSGAQKVLHSFPAATGDGAFPYAGLVTVGAKLYGTTEYGGSYLCGSPSQGCGTIFEVSKSGAEQVVYRFAGGTDGAFPNGGLTVINGNLYGTTTGGGTSGNGTVFEVKTSGAEQVLYSFKGSPDGAAPETTLVALKSNLYGATNGGGTSGNGAAFKVSTSGAERVLYSFMGAPDGSFPQTNLIILSGKLYGTTAFGGSGSACGSGGCGTVFDLKP